MADKETHMRAMAGDLVLKVAELQAQNDILIEALTNEPLRQQLARQVAAGQAAVAPPAPPAPRKGSQPKS